MATSGRRQFVFYCLMGLTTLGAIEVGARLLARVAFPEQSIGEVSALRRQLVDELGDGRLAYQFESDIRGFDNEVLHPYLGFVFDPGANQREKRRDNGMLEVTRLGFLRLPGEQPAYADKDTSLGIFGGSVAMLFSFHGRDALSEILSAARPELGSIGVRSLALGGYKQPQALMTLNYLLTLGEEIEIIVNLDGFNELALSWFDNYQHRIFPPYPRAWRQRVEGLSSRSFLRLLSRRDALRKTRVAIARGFELPVPRSLAISNVIWLSIDRQLATTDKELAQAIGDSASAGEHYALQGPFTTADNTDALLSSLVDVWQRSSLQMHHLSRANGITYCHFLQPNQYDLGGKPLSAEEAKVAIHQESPYQEAIKLGYPMLRKAGQALKAAGVCFADLSTVFAKIEEPLYTDDCCHFNRTGSRIVAAAVAKVVARDLATRQGSVNSRP